jgi:hypothetical protein
MGKMEKVSVTDLYEACYLLLNGAELETVRCIPAGKNINCELVLCGGSLSDLMDEYYQKNAMVNPTRSTGGPGATRPRSWFSPSRDLWFTKTDGVSSSQGIRAYKALRVFWIRYSL